MKLTIAMAAYDDYDGVYFTLQSLRLHHQLPEATEFLILDNNPVSAHGKALEQLQKSIPQMRVLPVTDRKSSFVKYEAFRHAAGEVILVLDCHVLLKHGFVPALLDYWTVTTQAKNMLTGPLIYNDLKSTSVKMIPSWRGHDFGCWGDDKEAMAAGLPFEIPMQGMGCFSFLRDGFPQINPHFRGFGAEEWYIAEKVRGQGGRVICHPAMGWNHRFDWPPRTFPLTLEDKVKNYYRGWLEVYGSVDHPMIRIMSDHWLTTMGRAKLESLIAAVVAESKV